MPTSPNDGIIYQVTPGITSPPVLSAPMAASSEGEKKRRGRPGHLPALGVRNCPIEWSLVYHAGGKGKPLH